MLTHQIVFSFAWVFSFSLDFFFTCTAAPEIYTLSLHDALPIFYSSLHIDGVEPARRGAVLRLRSQDRKSTRLNSSHVAISYAVFCLKKKAPEYTVVYSALEHLFVLVLQDEAAFDVDLVLRLVVS